jgi:hypothetical protein
VILGSQADRKQVEHYSSILTKVVAERFLRRAPQWPFSLSFTLSLDKYTSIEDDAANVLANYGVGELDLSGLVDLSEAAANSLSQRGSWIKLNGLKEIDVPAAQALARSVGHFSRIELHGLEQISVNVAEALGGHRGTLELNGLRSLSAEEAMALSNHTGLLTLDGLPRLGIDAAEALAHNHKGNLSLQGLTELDDGVAKALAEHIRGIDMQTSLNAKVKQYKGGLLTKGVAEQFIDGKEVILNSFTEIEDAAAEALAKHQGALSLNGLTSLSDKAAEALAKCEDLDLPASLKAKVEQYKGKP